MAESLRGPNTNITKEWSANGMTVGVEGAEHKQIVVVEDEPDLSSLLEYVLGQEGFEVRVAADGRTALEELDRAAPDLVVLDLMLPDLDGFEILQKIKGSTNGLQNALVIILSARNDEMDRVRGFELGADDYVVKPFSPRELLLRIKTALGRSKGEEAKKTEVLTAGPIEIDSEHHLVHVDGKPVHLTLTEFKLLTDMVRNQGRVRTRETLMTEVWGYDSEAMSRTVDTHVRRLRVKLGPAAVWLGTVRGVGYRIRKPEDAD